MWLVVWELPFCTGVWSIQTTLESWLNCSLHISLNFLWTSRSAKETKIQIFEKNHDIKLDNYQASKKCLNFRAKNHKWNLNNFVHFQRENSNKPLTLKNIWILTAKIIKEIKAFLNHFFKFSAQTPVFYFFIFAKQFFWKHE